MGSPVSRLFISMATSLLLAACWLLAGCSPIAGGPGSASKHPQAFTLVIHNQSVAFEQTATVTWWQASTIVGKRSALVPANGERSFLIAPRPDGLEVDTDSWPAQAGGLVWQSTDWAGAWVFHVYSPNGASRIGP